MIMAKIRKAVIPVAGFGTRFLPATIAQPKEMLPLVDKPVIQYLVEEMVESGIEEIIFITGRGKRAIEDHFDPSFELEHLLDARGKKDKLKEVRRISNLAKFVYVRQPKPLGNGHALLMAREVVGDEPFAFSYGDDILDSRTPGVKQMIQAYNKYQDMIIGVVEVDKKKVDQYGIVDPQENSVTKKVFELKGIVEKPAISKAPSQFASIGRYIFNPDIFTALETLKPGKGGEIWVADAVDKIFKERSIYACNLAGTYYDCGNKLEYIKAVVNYSLKHPDLKRGVKKYLKKQL
jgi:UTP--glucose-1-phosphate uridylyltransferase